MSRPYVYGDASNTSPVLPYTNKPKPRRPFIAMLLVAIQMGLLLYCFHLGGWKMVPFARNPMLGPDPSVLQHLSTLVTSNKLETFLSFLSALFLHTGVVPLVLTGVTTLVIGADIEKESGPLTLLMIYLFSGVSGLVGSTAFSRSDAVIMGAVGALFGLFGSEFAYFAHHHDEMGSRKWSHFTMMLISAIMVLSFGLHPHVDNFVNVFGFVGGLLMGLVVFVSDRGVGENRFRRTSAGLCIAAVFFVIAAAYMAGLVYLLLLGPDKAKDLCPMCCHLTCVETPWWNCANVCPFV